MVNLVCVGCSTPYAIEGTAIPQHKNVVEVGDGAEVYIICPLCDRFELTGLELVGETKARLEITETVLCRTVLGQGFYDLALFVCQVCKSFHTVSLLDHGLMDLGLAPGSTYLTTCHVCYGKEHFLVVGEAARYVGKDGRSRLKVVKTLDLKVEVKPAGRPADDEEGIVEYLSSEEYDKHVLSTITNTMEVYQADGTAATTRKRVAEALYVSISTAGRYLKKLVNQGFLKEIRNGSTTYYTQVKET